MSTDAPTGPALLCWDGLDSARRAIAQAAAILRPGHPARVFFAYVPTEEANGVAGALAGIDAPTMGPSDAEALLDQGVAAARAAGFEASPQSVVADAKTADLIVAAAEELDSPAIVMGQRGRSALGAVLLGSVARDVISNSAHRPVIVVSPSAAPHTGAPARPGG
jgi:nucleotide-binding universal stress UspA family protein